MARLLRINTQTRSARDDEHFLRTDLILDSRTSSNTVICQDSRAAPLAFVRISHTEIGDTWNLPLCDLCAACPLCPYMVECRI
jgi:hypothetical protein